MSGNIAYLPQEPMILEETIKINISLEKDIEKINVKKILQSIKRANLESVILKLPNGLDTLIGKGGVRLSGGQNKVALARTFYHGKEFIIMDEATSSLDKKAEDFIAEKSKILREKSQL